MNSKTDIRSILSAHLRGRFVVIDGAHFDDILLILKRARLFARSLFLDNADSDLQKAGPWLLDLEQRSDALESVIDIVGDLPGSVYWCCDKGEHVLWRHLRTLNSVKVPVWAANSTKCIIPSDEANYEGVMFRHWDPRVLGALMPLLDEKQFARIIGPASELAFQAEDYGGVRRVIASPQWPSATSGPLLIRSSQLELLNIRRSSASRQRIATYLRQHASLLTEHATEDQLIEFVQESEVHGRRLGLESEAAHGRWAYLMLRTEKRILQKPQALEFIRSGDRPPDEQIQILVAQTALAIRKRESPANFSGLS